MKNCSRKAKLKNQIMLVSAVSIHFMILMKHRVLQVQQFLYSPKSVEPFLKF